MGNTAPEGIAARAASLDGSAGGRRSGQGVSTFVLLTITGLGLGAMYFLVASGLSLIYGLMGVLNFAHGAFITFGAYAAWWLTTQISTSFEGAPRGHGIRSRRRRSYRGSRRIRLHPSALPPSDRAGARHGRSRSLAWGPRLRDLGRRSADLPVPDWMFDTTTILGANIPNDRFVEIAVAVIVLAGLISFLRFTRVRLIIRAGVENRAMVTALGIDVRKAFTSSSRSAARSRLSRAFSRIYFGSVDPEGDVAPHLRLHRRRHRGLRVDRGLGGRGGRGRARPAVRELLRRRLARLERRG